MFSGVIQLSSTGRAAERVGYIQGKYEYVSDGHYYVQCACENIPWDTYIYLASDDYFYVGETLGATTGWLRNGPWSPGTEPYGEALPSSGWEVGDGGPWVSDPTVRIEYRQECECA